MASAAITSSPGQQPPADGEIQQPSVPVAVSASSSAWHSSGSIGPFFGVISVLAVLAILSCFVGRICSRRAVAPPPDNIKHRGYLGWMKRRSRWCWGGDVEVGANKVMAFGGDHQAKDGEVDQQLPPTA
ncbi:hypothetical protein P3X46_017169 [Hevea brasiliensis]|uniref:Uncharacterized protein n=1 Tax=Hevea brasiliensis TaxID=3981 RepID=A0ABQ9M1F1_HEVBR|nr:uncharacterized protein LOC110662129 [Hevea brasiliensis]KAJ9174106.1 hypothetical protein P3X46_017169 [Hevea brasiliensis]